MTRARIVAAAAAFCALSAYAQPHDHAAHHAMAARHPAAAPAAAKRQTVGFPKALREHTLANMRDHLLALQEIQSALAKADYDRAADIAEQRLGMSSLGLHGAHEAARYMPKGMQDAGTAMHRSASRFAIAARDAAATGDVKPPLDLLSQVTGACVACHSGYRFK
ncbi:MAG: hypothetical protein JNM82_08995 [Rhodocyclaceae bacterium]|nr:hypothetical protein [Rhodocyclaceae bacterium]